MIKDSNFVEKEHHLLEKKIRSNRLPIFASRILTRLNRLKYLFTYPSKQTAESFFLSTTIDQNKVWQQFTETDILGKEQLDSSKMKFPMGINRRKS